jgi:hypothetical protein
MSNKIKENSVNVVANDLSFTNNNPKHNLRKLIKKNIKARLTSRKFNGNNSQRDKLNLIQTKKNVDIPNIIQNKIKNKNEAKEILLKKEPNNINKIQENKTVNFFDYNRKLRHPLKINYHFKNRERSRNSFNIISENNEQVSNVYNTYQKSIPNKIVNIKSFIQKIINKKLVKKESDNLSNPKIPTAVNLINYKKSNIIPINNDSIRNSIRSKRLFIDINNKNISASNTFYNKNSNKNKNGPFPQIKESKNNIKDDYQGILKKELEKIDAFIDVQINTNVLLVETLLRLSEKMEKFFEKFNINNS